MLVLGRLFRPYLRVIVSSKVFQAVFGLLFHNSALFLASCCCSFLLHNVANLICILSVSRQLFLLSTLPKFIHSFCGQEVCIRLFWKMSWRLMSFVNSWHWTRKTCITPLLFPPSYKIAWQLKVLFMFCHTSVRQTIWLLELYLPYLPRNLSDERSKWERRNGSLSRWHTRYALYSFFVTSTLTSNPPIDYKQTTTLLYTLPFWSCCLFSSVTIPLTFQSPRLTLCTNSFNIQKFCVLPTMHLYVLCGSQNKQRLFLYTALTDWFL